MKVLHRAPIKWPGPVLSTSSSPNIKHMEILVPEVASYVKGFMCEVYAQTLCSLGESSEKPFLKLKKCGSFYKTMYKNVVFSNYFQKIYKFAFFSTLDDVFI